MALQRLQIRDQDIELGDTDLSVSLYQQGDGPALVWLCEHPCDGTYHVSNAGAASRWEWAREVLRLAGWGEVPVEPSVSSEWPAPAARPAFSVLRRFALELRGADDMPPWQDALARFVEELRAAGELPARSIQ